MQHVVVNGLESQVTPNRELIDSLLLPALAAMTPLPGNRRAFAFLVGPPGSGKSTLAELVRQAAAEKGIALDVVGMDGFHHRQEYLATHFAVVNGRRVRLADVKGAPESFDIARLDDFLTRTADEDVYWPAYDRRLHDVVDDQLPVTADLVLVEGNWLLLDEPGWRDLRDHARLTIAVDADPAMLRERLIARKRAGGTPLADAEAFYQASDRLNVVRCLEHTTRSVDLALTMQSDGQLIRKGTRS
jgi:pantothenate kinase